LNNEIESVFIEGEVNAEIVGRFKSRCLFSATENKILNVSAFQLGNDKEDQLKKSAIDQIVRFYNRFDSYFLKSENTTGMNVWFLEHFRINFKFIEQLKTLELREAFLAAHPDGRIVQSPPPKARVNSGKQILKEVFFIVQNSLSRSSKISGTALVHNEGGPDFSASELFGDLTNHFPTLKVRSLFDLKRRLPKSSKFTGFPNSDALFFQTLLSPKTWFQVKRFRLGLDSIVNYIENESLNSFERELIQHLKAKKTYFTLMYLRYLSFQNFFINSKIESIILSDENSPQQKVIQYAARKTAVKVFAIQHGAIYNNHFGYTYGKYIHPPILPDVTFTWGEFYNEVLLKHGGYQAEQVKAVGSLRKSRTSTSGSTPKDNKSRVVLFASQPIPNETLRLQYLKDVFHCFLAVEAECNYQLIIRPHPNEKDDQYFVNVANEVGFSNYSIERNVAMEDQFNTSDILITAYSTVGAEYVEYFKPIVVLDYLKEDIAGYVKEGVGIPVHNGNELMEVFERQVIDVDHQKYNKFISRFFHSADQKAADRILKILTDK
tara:strand:+ start:166560 stop:168206 length:1647 start_codon:yes stop_codon:yes gene_type:complete